MPNTFPRRPKLAPPHTAPTFDVAAQQNYSARFNLAFDSLGDCLRANDRRGAEIWARTLNGVAQRIGVWRYLALEPRAISLWCGPEGYAARLLRLEIDLVERDNEAARAAHEILRGLFVEITQREQLEAYELEVA